jgi:pimeloyl-ACP methyl ester carboxylesterase
MASGSGPHNRDGEMFNHRPFAVIADFLARQGVATLRYDDRGVGKSSGKTKNISIEDIMLDAESGLECLRSRFRNIGVLGHSEGGTVAFMLAQRGKVDFIVSLAGSVLKMEDVLDEQLRMRLKSAGTDEREIAKSLPALKKAFVKDDGIRRYLDYDPIDAVKATHCPVFALNGEKDTQVLCEKHLSVLRDNLVPKEKMKIKSYPGLNHLFQHCKTGEFSEYATIEETISPEVLSDIVSFVKSVCKKKFKSL